MSEGKLRRKIKEMFPILDPKMNIADSRRIELLDLVEEVKKEFPILDTSNSLVSAVKFAIEVEIWQKKWLGDK